MAKPPPDPVFILRGSTSPISSIRVPGDSLNTLYCGNQQGQILVWDLKTKRVIRTIEAHPKSTVLWIKTTEDGSLISQGRDGQVKIWEIVDNKWCEQASFNCSSQTFCAASVFLLNEVNHLILPSNDQSVIEIINIKNSQVLSTLKPTDDKYGMCMCVKYIKLTLDHSFSQVATQLNSETNTSESNSRELLLVGYENGCILLWDVLSKTILSRLDLFKDSIMCMDFSQKLLKGLCGSVNNELKTFTIDLNMKLVLTGTILVTNEGFSSISIRHDNKLVVTTGWDSTIRLFSMKTWKPLAVLKYHKESVQCSAYTTDNMLICGAKDSLISLWKIY